MLARILSIKFLGAMEDLWDTALFLKRAFHLVGKITGFGRQKYTSI